MNGQGAKIGRQISYDQCVFRGWLNSSLITAEFLHSSLQARRSSVTNSRISYKVGKVSKLKSFWTKIFYMSQLAACLTCDIIIYLHIFVSSVLTQLLCSFLSSLHKTAEQSLSRELPVSSVQGSTRLLSNSKFHYRAHKSSPLDPSSARWL